MLLSIFIISLVTSLMNLVRQFKTGKSSYGSLAAINVLSSWMLWTTVGIVALCVHGTMFLIALMHVSKNKQK